MGKFKTKNNIENIVIGLISIFLFALLVRRLYYTLSYNDEVFNIYISYLTVGMGKRHLVENTSIFSMGNLFNLPFVYLFYKITGGTDGIVLFVRYAQLGINILLAIIFFQVFYKYLGKRNSVLFGLIIVTYSVCSVYSISYDTAALFFLLAGELLLIGAELRDNKKCGTLKYFAGICHACMVYAYPTMIVVILILFFGITFFYIKRDKMKMKKVIGYWIPYVMGGTTIFTIFLVYVLKIGVENIYFLKKYAIESVISSRTLGNLTTTVESGAVKISQNAFITQSLAILKNIGFLLYSIFRHIWLQQKATLIVSLVMLMQWFYGLKHDGKIRKLLILEIILVAVFFHNGIVNWSETSMYTYYFFWSPFLYFYLNNEDKKIGKILLLVLWISSIGALFAVGLTAANNIKAPMGLYSGAICTFLFMILIAKGSLVSGVKVSLLIILLIASGNLFIFYENIYEGVPVNTCDYKMQEGIYKGIMTSMEDAPYEKMGEVFKELKLKKDSNMYISDMHYTAAYMEGELLFGMNLLPIELRFREGENMESLFDKNTWPDVILIREKNLEVYTIMEHPIILENYELAYVEKGHYHLYIKK